MSGSVPWTSVHEDARADPHPTPVSESATLHATLMPPPTYALRAAGPHLSQMQLETVQHAMTALLGARTFALGDGTGTGKGRCIAAVVREWVAHHGGVAADRVRVLWVSANLRLHDQALDELDLLEGATNKAATSTAATDGEPARPWFRFASYTCLRRVSACDQLSAWLRSAPAPPLVLLDECHILRARRRLFDAVSQLIGSHPRRTAVLYSSATMMSDATHLLYLCPRLPLYSGADAPFDDAKHMQHVLQTSPAALELVAMYLRSRGLYLSRQLSMEGVAVETLRAPMPSSLARLYDQVVRTGQTHGVSGAIMQRVLLRLITALKARAAIAHAEGLLARGWNVVFSVCRTGEASTERCLRARRARPPTCVEDYVAHLERIDEHRDQAGRSAETIDARTFPLDAVDQIVHHFGPMRVAEITGRSNRYVPNGNGGHRVERISLEDEVRAFQAGTKRVAILSRAGGLGISLHDVGAGRRANIVLELPWSAEEFVQLIGRFYRSGSHTTPLYVLCMLDVPGEHRVAHSLSRRVASLGALTRGDRTACDTLNLLPEFGAGTTCATRRSVAVRLAVARLASAWRERVDAHALEAPFRERAALCRARRSAHRQWHRPHAPTARLFQMLLRAIRATQARVPPSGADIAADDDGGVPEDLYSDTDDDVQSNDSDAVAGDVFDADALSDSSDGPTRRRGALWRGTAELLSASLLLVPSMSATAVWPTWTPERHFMYAPPERDAVYALLLAHAHPSAARTLGLLPHALLLLIVEHVLHDATDLRAINEALSLEDLERMHDGMTREHFLNTLLRLPIGAQRAAMRVVRASAPASAATADEQHDGLTLGRMQRIEAVASERAGKGAVAEIRSVGEPNAAGLCVVAFDYRIERHEAPRDAAVWCHTRSNALYWAPLGATTGMAVDGSTASVDGDEYARSTLEAFDRREARYHRHCVKRCARLHTKLVVSTHRALHDWEHSLKKIVRVPSWEDVPGFVGLLVDVQP